LTNPVLNPEILSTVKFSGSGCRRDGDMHIGCGVEIVIGDVDVLAAGPWLWTDEQPRLILVVHAVEVGCRLGDARWALEIIEREACWVAVERTVDIVRPRSKECSR
jgi:hypothetical protein